MAVKRTGTHLRGVTLLFERAQQVEQFNSSKSPKKSSSFATGVENYPTHVPLHRAIHLKDNKVDVCPRIWRIERQTARQISFQTCKVKPQIVLPCERSRALSTLQAAFLSTMRVPRYMMAPEISRCCAAVLASADVAADGFCRRFHMFSARNCQQCACKGRS
jgi:hypothetical protein